MSQRWPTVRSLAGQAELAAPETPRPANESAVERRPEELRLIEALLFAAAERSEERRVGKECSLLCRSRWSPYH